MMQSLIPSSSQNTTLYAAPSSVAQNLNEEYVTVLQQIHESGSDDFVSLADTLHYDRGHLAQIIEVLQNMDLVIRDPKVRYGAWLALSTQGKQYASCLSA